MSVAVKETAKNEKDGGFSTPSDFRSHFLEIRLFLEIHHTTLACRSYVIPLPPDNSLESLERNVVITIYCYHHLYFAETTITIVSTKFPGLQQKQIIIVTTVFQPIILSSRFFFLFLICLMSRDFNRK